MRFSKQRQPVGLPVHRLNLLPLLAASTSIRAAVQGARAGVAYYPCCLKHTDAKNGIKAKPAKRTGELEPEAVEVEDVIAEIDDIAKPLPGVAGPKSAAIEDAVDGPLPSESDEDLSAPLTFGTARGRRGVQPAFDDGLVASAADKSTSATPGTAKSGADAKATADKELQDFEGLRRGIMLHLDRLRRLDAIALQGRQEADGRARAGGVGGASSIVDVSRSTSLDATDADGAALADAKSLPEAGPPVDYCIFCYHGTYGVLRPDNVALLTRFVSERGSILPKRFTHCCAKHQRKLAATIRAARNFNLIPFHSKLHPRLRFSNMIPASPSTFRQSAAGGAGVGKGQAQGPSAVQILAGLNTGSLGGARA